MKRRAFIIATGAGAGAQQRLWSTPGCSEFFAGAAFPYAQDQTDEILGFAPERYCSPETAIDLAMAAYYRAWLPGSDAIGVGLSASVASLMPHRGEHRIHAAVMTGAGVWLHSVTLPKGVGAGARASDGAAADQVILAMLDHPEQFEPATAEARTRLFARPHWTATGARRPWSPKPGTMLFPGAFNPPHAGHVEPAERLGAVFHVTADPPHKPALSVAELVQRAKMLHGRARLFTEGDALYIEKARRNPGAGLVIGADALERMLDPKWGPDPRAMLYEFARLGTTFHVIDRGSLTMASVLEAARVPLELGYLFRGVEGRWNVSSTELRASA